MRVYVFSREITKRGPINKYGKLGYKTHREVVCFETNSEEEALKKLTPFNKGKHIKFRKDYSLHYNPNFECDKIIDMGSID